MACTSGPISEVSPAETLKATLRAHAVQQGILLVADHDLDGDVKARIDGALTALPPKPKDVQGQHVLGGGAQGIVVKVEVNHRPVARKFVPLLAENITANNGWCPCGELAFVLLGLTTPTPLVQVQKEHLVRYQGVYIITPDELPEFAPAAVVGALLAAAVHPVLIVVFDMGFCPDGTVAAWAEQREATRLPSPPRGLYLALADEAHGFSGLDVPQAASFCLDYIQAVAALHGARLMHGDVKPENTLLIRGEGRHGLVKLVLTDLSGARAMDETGSIGPGSLYTPVYVPLHRPALPGSARRHASDDIFAAGVSVGELLWGSDAFHVLFPRPAPGSGEVLPGAWPLLMLLGELRQQDGEQLLRRAGLCAEADAAIRLLWQAAELAAPQWCGLSNQPAFAEAARRAYGWLQQGEAGRGAAVLLAASAGCLFPAGRSAAQLVAEYGPGLEEVAACANTLPLLALPRRPVRLVTVYGDLLDAARPTTASSAARPTPPAPLAQAGSTPNAAPAAPTPSSPAALAAPTPADPLPACAAFFLPDDLDFDPWASPQKKVEPEQEEERQGRAAAAGQGLLPWMPVAAPDAIKAAWAAGPELPPPPPLPLPLEEEDDGALPASAPHSPAHSLAAGDDQPPPAVWVLAPSRSGDAAQLAPAAARPGVLRAGTCSAAPRTTRQPGRGRWWSQLVLQQELGEPAAVPQPPLGAAVEQPPLRAEGVDDAAAAVPAPATATAADSLVAARAADRGPSPPLLPQPLAPFLQPPAWECGAWLQGAQQAWAARRRPGMARRAGRLLLGAAGLVLHGCIAATAAAIA